MSRPDPSTWTEADLIADVDAGPQGQRVGAFFDFDGTLIDGYSLRAFARHHLRSGHVTPGDLGRLLLIGVRGLTSEADFERFFLLGMRAWAGRREDELVELGERLWHQGVAGSLYPEAWRLVEAHRRAGHTVVLASSATRFQVEPAARAMGVGHVLVTPVEVADGLCTGRPGGPPLWRAGKAAAVREFAAAHGVDLVASYAYSNGDEDVPFLQTAGRARALNPGEGLAAAAAAHGWPVARFRPRGRDGMRGVARALGAVGGTLGGFGAGLMLGTVNRVLGQGTRRAAVDLGISLAGELGTALAGVRLDVRGAEHLVAPRPAVFLFNHQSQLDVLILAKLLRGGFTAVAKKEAASIPGFGAAFRLADVAFVDRSDTTAAKAALEPAVQRLREGISLVIAPEGTRSATPALGPFKKGAFHVAMQAGVPVVPIVIRNAGELMWRGASTIREGTVQVTVLPPVATDAWAADTVGSHVEHVRTLYLDTLANWDGSPDRVPRNAVQVTAGPLGPVPDEPLDWGRDPTMDARATAIWRAGPHTGVTLLEILDAAPDPDRFASAHEWASRMVPRMRETVVEPAIGPPVWTPATRFDADAHLARIRLPAPGSMRQLLDAVATFAAAPLPRDRPLWAALLVDGLDGHRAGYATKIHHSVTDGVGAVRLLGLLHSRSAERDPQRPEPPVPVARAARQQMLAPESLLDRSAGAIRALARRAEPGEPGEPGGRGSPLLAGRGGQWRLEVLEVPLAALAAGAAAAGGSVTDGYLAAVLGGLGRYHEAFGIQDVPVLLGVPVGLGAEDDPAGRAGVGCWSAPLHESDPPARVRLVRDAVLATSNPDVPSWITTPQVQVQARALPGIGHPVFIAGSRIGRLYPFGPLAGSAAALTMVAHDDTCCIGITLDTAAVTEPEVLLDGLREGFAEVLALG